MNISITKSKLFSFVLLFLLYSCESDSTDSMLSNTANEATLSVNDDSMDNLSLSLSITGNKPADFKEYRFFVFRSDSIQSDTFQLEKVLSIANYYESKSSNITLNENDYDVSGNLLKEFMSYQALAISVVTDSTKSLISNLSKQITLVKSTSINGYWTGNGSTNLFPTFNIVLDAFKSEGYIVGIIYYGSTIPPTTQNHHNFRAKIVGSRLLEIKLTNNPICVGEFSGEGTIQNGVITMNTPGTDCDGVHTSFRTTITKTTAVTK